MKQRYIIAAVPCGDLGNVTALKRVKITGSTLADFDSEQQCLDWLFQIHLMVKTCQTCKHKDDSYCTHPKIEDLTRRWGCINHTKLPDDFGCVHWESKV